MLGRTLAHYEITDRLGEGGMGEVYRATDTRLKREVALKILPPHLAADPSRLERFQREAESIARLNHPHIVTVYSIDEAEGLQFLTMELVDGRPGNELVGEQLDPRQLREIAVALCDAVAAAHEHGVIHRDLKPANLMLTSRGGVKVLDFGLAKLQAPLDEGYLDDEGTELATTPGTVLGTRAYMAPEQLQGLNVDEKADVFSLGVTLYELAAGRHPFPGPSPAQQISAILRDAPRPLLEVRGDLPPDLADSIHSCLHKSPAERPTASELHQRLLQPSRTEDRRASNSVAVLSFADLSPDHDQDYLCEGLADELMNAFSKLEGLKVASRTSCLQFKNVAADIREIGRRLGVDTVVEGSVRKAGNRLRISAQLTKVEDGYQLWAERYDRELEDVFAIQEDIAARIVAALEISLSPRERRALQLVQTADPRAYELYLRGRHYQQRLDRSSLEIAREMFEQAIALDPRYARAYCGIVDCVSYLFMLHDADEGYKVTVEEASRRALELDPQLPEAHLSRGQAHLVRSEYEAADAAFETAIRIDPRLFEAHYYFGRSCFLQGEVDRAAVLFQRAHQLRPDDYQSLQLLATSYRSRGEHEKELQALRGSLERIREYLVVYPEDVRARYFGGGALIALGEREEGLRWVRRALAMSPKDPHVGYNVACSLTRAGEYEEALDCLENMVAGLKSRAYYAKWIRNDPDFGPLRGMERFERLLGEFGGT